MPDAGQNPGASKISLPVRAGENHKKKMESTPASRPSGMFGRDFKKHFTCMLNYFPSFPGPVNSGEISGNSGEFWGNSGEFWRILGKFRGILANSGEIPGEFSIFWGNQTKSFSLVFTRFPRCGIHLPPVATVKLKIHGKKSEREFAGKREFPFPFILFPLPPDQF